jgi:geranylgeranyl pyrophosphate synthase
MVSVIQNPHFTIEDFRKLVELLGSSGAVRYAEQAAEKYISLAKKKLTAFPPSETLETLVDIADYALHRRV